MAEPVREDGWCPDTNPVHRLVQIIDVLATAMTGWIAEEPYYLAVRKPTGIDEEALDQVLSTLPYYIAWRRTSFVMWCAVLTHRLASLSSCVVADLVRAGLPVDRARAAVTDAAVAIAQAAERSPALKEIHHEPPDRDRWSLRDAVGLLACGRASLLTAMAEAGERLPVRIAERRFIEVPADQLPAELPKGLADRHEVHALLNPHADGWIEGTAVLLMGGMTTGVHVLGTGEPPPRDLDAELVDELASLATEHRVTGARAVTDWSYTAAGEGLGQLIGELLKLRGLPDSDTTRYTLVRSKRNAIAARLRDRAEPKPTVRPVTLGTAKGDNRATDTPVPLTPAARGFDVPPLPGDAERTARDVAPAAKNSPDGRSPAESATGG